MLPEIEGWRKLDAQFPGHCEKCGKYIEPRVSCYHSPTLKKIRCISCHVENNMAEQAKNDMFEVWTAEIADENGNKTTNNIVTTRGTRIHGEINTNVCRLIGLVASHHRSETTMKALREQYGAIRIPE